MRGFPKVLKTKMDYLNCLAMYPERTKQALKTLYADRFIWQKGEEVESEEAGVTDDTHKVVTEKVDGVDKYYQYALVEDSNARVFRLGFTAEEIEELTK